MGAKGRQERKSERKATVARENARRPRGRWANTQEREQLEEAKAELRAGLPAGARRIRLLLETGGDPGTFLKAFEIAASPAGLPALAQQEVVSEPPVLIIERANLPKPSAGAAVGGG
jgi:hypothetical protein